MGNKEQALLDYNMAIQIDPLNAEFYYIRGDLYHDMDNKEQALIDYNKAILLDPINAKTYCNRGNQSNYI